MPATTRHEKMNHNQVTNVVVSDLFELIPSVSTLLMMMPTFHLKINNLILMTFQSHPQITSSTTCQRSATTLNSQPLAYNERPRSLKDEDPIDNVDEYNARVPPQAMVYEELTHPPRPFNSPFD